jgi:ribosomal protein S18 acetylase RimI-like enzyme
MFLRRVRVTGSRNILRVALRSKPQSLGVALLSEIVVREARPEEYGFVGDLVVDVYRTLGDAEDAAYDALLRDLESRAISSRVLVAEIDGSVLGTATYVRPGGVLAEVDDPSAATVRMLGVAPAARGRGIGQALVRSCILEAIHDGAARIRLDTRTSMTSAQRLYERFGFVRDPEHDWSPTSDIDLLAYVLDFPTGSQAGDISGR